MAYRLKTYLTVNGKLENVELPDSAYGEWIVYCDEKPTYHIDCFRKKSKSDMIIKGLLGSNNFSIASIISRINKEMNTKLELISIPVIRVKVKSEIVELDLKPLPDQWLKIFNYSITPPWISYPEVSKYDMFWRMGKGEDYLMRFNEYFSFLPPIDQKKYKLKYPPPEEWNEFYETE